MKVQTHVVEFSALFESTELIPAEDFPSLYRMAATFFVQPLDLVKNRMQMSGK